jgi:hypothetical protein
MFTLLSILTPAIPGLIHVAEAAFTKPAAGSSKMDAVVGSLKNLGLAIVASQFAPGITQQVPDALLREAVEKALAEMKAQGTVVRP